MAKEWSTEVKLRREEAAAYLEALAAGVRRGKLRVRLGRSAVTLAIPARVELEVEVEKDGGEVELEVGLSWKGRVGTRVPKLHLGPAD